MVADEVERCFRIGQGQEVAQEGAFVSRPGEVLREETGIIPVDQPRQPPEMGLVERARGADGKAYAMQG